MNRYTGLTMAFGWVLAAMMVLIYGFMMRRGLPAFVGVLELMHIAMLATVVFLLPQWLFLRKQRDAWWHNPEFYTVATLLSLSLIGLTFGRWIGASVLAPALLWVPGTALLIWTVFRRHRASGVFSAAIAAAFAFFFIQVQFSTEELSPFFYEYIVMGTAFIDTLNHASISSMIGSFLTASTGVDGLMHYSYHWGSHALFAGLSNLMGVDAVTFYNYAYPAVFLPLLFQCMIWATGRILQYYGKIGYHEWTVLTIMAVLFSTSLFAFKPFSWMESTTVSNIWMLLYLGILVAFVTRGARSGTPATSVHSARSEDGASGGETVAEGAEVEAHGGQSGSAGYVPVFERHSHREIVWFYLFSAFVVWLVAVTKISAGFVLAPALGWLVLRTDGRRAAFAFVVGSGLLLALFVLKYIVFFDKVPHVLPDMSLNARIYYVLNRVGIYFQNTPGSIAYISGLLVVLTTLARWGYVSSARAFTSAWKSRRFPELEMLFILIVLGFLGSLVVSDHPLDVFFFMNPQYLFAMLMAFAFLCMKVERAAGSNARGVSGSGVDTGAADSSVGAEARSFGPTASDAVVATERPKGGVSGVYRAAAVLLVLGACFISRPDLIDNALKKSTILKYTLELDDDRFLLYSLLQDVQKLHKSADKSVTAIHVPLSELWFHHSQVNLIGTSFIVPGLSGFAMVGGMAEQLFYSDVFRYGYSGYINARSELTVTIDDAVQRAALLGYERLVVYEGHGRSLSRRILDVRAYGESHRDSPTVDSAPQPQPTPADAAANLLLPTTDSNAQGSDSDSYSEQVPATPAESEVSEDVLYYIDHEGNRYRTTSIAGRIWMASNLRTRHFSNGDDIPETADPQSWRNAVSAAFTSYDLNEEFSHDVGYLYNWYAVSDPRGLCAAGWRVPTEEDWSSLEAYLGVPGRLLGANSGRGHAQNAGGKLKSNGSFWPGENAGAVDAYGFGALPSGGRLYNGSFTGLGNVALFWSSSVRNTNNVQPNRVWVRLLSSHGGYITRFSTFKQSGLAVRCILDEEGD